MSGGEKLVEDRVREESVMGEVENGRDGVMEEESAWQRERQSCSTTTFSTLN